MAPGDQDPDGRDPDGPDPDGPDPEDPAFCGQCGRPAAGAGHERCAARRALEPPRFCPDCARRMVVQVTPTGWTARCSRHGARAG